MLLMQFSDLNRIGLKSMLEVQVVYPLLGERAAAGSFRFGVRRPATLKNKWCLESKELRLKKV